MTKAVNKKDVLFQDRCNGSLSFALITPARNEQATIEKTICSVTAQTRRPDRWVIVSDGSTDATDNIVRRYLKDHSWIELVRIPEHPDRHFASKVRAFNAGFARIKDQKIDIVGNLDGDTSFDADLFELLIRQFERDPRLGVAGAPFIEDGAQVYDYQFTNVEHVSGICQLFRRQCFEEIGGYTPISGGGIDWLAVTTARMKGWKTRTFSEKTILHHRKIGTGQIGSLKAKVRLGEKDYNTGNLLIWELSRAFYQAFRGRPVLLGGLLLLWGYLCAMVRRKSRPVPDTVVEFARREQIKRLKGKAREMLFPNLLGKLTAGR